MTQLPEKPTASSPERVAFMEISLGATVACDVHRWAATIKGVRLHPKKGKGVQLAVRRRRVEIDTTDGVRTTFHLPAPPGSYGAIEIVFERVEAMVEHKGCEPAWRPVSKQNSVTLPLDFEVSTARAPRVEVDIDSQRLLNDPKDSAASLRARLDDGSIGQELRAQPDGSQLFEGRLRPSAFGGAGKVSLRAPQGAFAPKVRIDFEDIGRGALPALFRGQHAVGPAVRLRSSEPPSNVVDVTLPYDPSLVVAWGRPAGELVVLALDEERRRYRELLPVAVDDQAHTLTVRTASLSYFFAGTPGIEILHPDFRRNAAGEVVAISARRTALLSGRATDERAEVTCAAATSGWTRLGWFLYDGIPLGGPAQNIVVLLAVVAGLVAHELALIIRRPPPSKRVTDPARLYGTSLVITPGNIPFVGAVINQSAFRYTAEPLLEHFAAWQRRYDRPAPYLYWWDTEAGSRQQDGVELRTGTWRSIGLMPDTHLENQAAAETIGTLNQVFANPVPRDPNHPEETRALRSLHDYVTAAAARDDFGGTLIAATAEQWLAIHGSGYGVGNCSYSPTLPMLAVSDLEVEAAFVAATASATASARTDPMRERFRDQLGPQRSNEATRPQVNAGALYYARVHRNGTLLRERVADDIWCARVALRRHPQSGRPFLLALGLEAPGADEPNTALLLFERIGPNNWRRQVINRQLPIFDADFTFLPNGVPRIVASQSGSRLEKPHLLAFVPQGRAWLGLPVNWRTEFEPEATDLGAFPRIEADADGNLALGFITPVLRGRIGSVDIGSRIRWMIAVPDGAGWRAAIVDAGSVNSLSSDLAPRRDGALAPGFRGQSGRGDIAFAPSLAFDPSGNIRYALGNGVLMLATIERATLAVASFSVDVDRRIGFAPALGLNSGGSPAIAYKDDFGTADVGPGARDVLAYFTLEAGNVIPSRDDLPRLPSHVRHFANTHGFAPYEALMCERLLTPNDFSRELIALLVFIILFNPGGAEEVIQGVVDTLVERKRPEDLITSIILHRRMHVDIVGGGPERVVGRGHWAFYRSHPEINAMLEAMPNRLRILQLTVDNAEHEREEIEHLDIAFFDPITVGGNFQPALDNGNFPEELRTALVARGLRMSAAGAVRAQRVLGRGEQVETPGREWRITDPDPFGAQQLWFPHIADPDEEDTRVPVQVRYSLRRRDDGGFDLTLDPLLTVTEREPFRDRDGRYAPCRVAQFWWDLFGRELAEELAGAVPDVSGGVENANHVRIRDARVSRIGPLTHPGDQQAAMQFVLSIGSLWARGRAPEHHDARFVARTTEPSAFRMAFSPYINDRGDLAWWDHAVQARIGHLEVDVVDWGDLDFLRYLISFIPLLGGLGILIADAVIDDTASDRVNDEVRAPGIGAFQNLLLQRFEQFVSDRLPSIGPPFEATFLENWTLWLWARRPWEEELPQAGFHVLPNAINFGIVPLGQQPPERRNLLIANHGALPMAIDEVRFEQASGAFRIVAPASWPRILLSGQSELVTVELVPRPPVGEKRASLRVRINGEDVDPPIPLAAFVQRALRIIARVEPDPLNFGVVPGGQAKIGIVRVFNDGEAQLDIPAYEIVAAPGIAAMFSINASAIQLPPGLGISEVVTYTPNASLPSPHRATLRVHSNDTEQPVREISLVGYAASATLLVDPTFIAFNPSPLAPLLPPGFGSTRGINIYNTGTAPLTLTADSLQIVDALNRPSIHFTLVEPGTFSAVPVVPAEQVIQPGATLPFDVLFRPQTVGQLSATMIIRATDPAIAPIHVGIAGEGQGG